MGSQTSVHESHGSSHGHSSNAVQGDVVIPDLFDTLEWVLSSPPPVHQFDEPPVSSRFFRFHRLFIVSLDCCGN
jgi:hypothetical protein